MQLGKKITNFFSSSQKKQKKEDESQQNLINSENSLETNDHSLPKNKDLETLLMPKGHENYSVDEKDKCPFYQMQGKVNNNQEQPS